MKQDYCSVSGLGNQLFFESCTDEQMQLVLDAVNAAFGPYGEIPEDYWTTVSWEGIVIKGKELASQPATQEYNPFNSGELPPDFNPLATNPPTQQPSNWTQQPIDIPWGTILVVAFAIGLVVVIKTPGATDKTVQSVKAYVDKCFKKIGLNKTSN